MRRLARFVFKRRKTSAPPEPLGRPKVLIFDFDGTVADTLHAGIRILNKLSTEFGYRALKDDEIELARNMRTAQLMKYLGISMTKMTRLARRGSEELTLCMPSVQPLPGMFETLQELHEAGFILGLVTSNTEANVTIFLKNHGINCFDFVRCSSKLMGKAREFRQVMKERKLTPSDLFSVGDETRDVEAARKAGIRIAAVTWGYNSEQSLVDLKPDFVFHRPEELVAHLKQLPES
ncbi:HAD family hydrolase [soil metagenome]